MPCWVTSSPKTIKRLDAAVGDPRGDFRQVDPIGVAAMPIKRAPALLGLRSALSSNLSASPARGTESVSAPSLAASFCSR